MKINIKKLGAGAGLTYEPLPVIPTQGPVPDAPEVPLDTELKGKALTSDAKVFQDQYNIALNQYNALSPQVRTTIQGRILRDRLKGNWAQMTALANSKEQLDRIITEKKDSMSEYAVFQGHVVAQDKENGDIVNLSLPEYSQSLTSESPKYKALTNGELINLRESDERFAGKNNVFPILNNAVSTESVLKNVRAALQNLGSSSKGSADTSYEQKRIGEGANAVLDQGLSYVKTSSGDFSQSNAENIKMAGNAMWAMLDDASKDLLRMKAIHYGWKSEQIEGAAMGLALAMLKPSIYEKTTEKDGETLSKTPGAKSGSTGKKVELDYWGAMGLGKGANESVTLSNGSNTKVIMQGETFAPFKKTKDSFYGTTSLDKMDNLGAVADMNSVYFGDKRIGSDLFDSVIYDNGKPAVVWMPFEEVDGSIKPNLDRAQDLADIKKEIEQKDITDSTVKMSMYQAKGFNNFDNKGEPAKTVELMPFITFSGFSNNNAIKEPSKWFEVKEERNAWYKKQFEEGPKKQVTSHYFEGWFNEPDVIQGMIYVPLRIGAAVSGQYASGDAPEIDSSYKDIKTYEGTNLGQLGGGRTYRQLDPNVDYSKNTLQ